MPINCQQVHVSFMQIALFHYLLFFQQRKKSPRGWRFARQYLHIFILALTAKSNSCVMFISWSLKQLPGKILNLGLTRFLCLFSLFIYFFCLFFCRADIQPLKINESALAVFPGTHFVCTSPPVGKQFLDKAF